MHAPAARGWADTQEHRYNAPEVRRQETTPIAADDLHKCDIWAFGLLVWETLKGGEHYFEKRWMAEASSSASAIAAADGDGVCVSNDAERSFDNFNLALLRAHALSFVAESPELFEGSDEFARAALRGLFLNTLQTDPVARRSNLNAFPLMNAWK